MKQIIIANEKLRYYEELSRVCEYVGYSDLFKEQLWADLIKDEGIYQELLYYLEHQDFLARVTIDGLTILDIFVWQMRKYNIRMDRGKNGSDCDKLAMLLETIRTMLDMKQGGAKVEWSMEMKNGMDEL